MNVYRFFLLMSCVLFVGNGYSMENMGTLSAVEARNEDNFRKLKKRYVINKLYSPVA